MEGILRFAQPGIIATLGAVIAVLVISHYVGKMMKSNEETAEAVKYVMPVRNAIVVLLALVFAWQLVVALSINDVNRSVIDRSGIDQNRYSLTATPFGQ